MGMVWGFKGSISPSLMQYGSLWDAAPTAASRNIIT
jgi:hypothetical protein